MLRGRPQVMNEQMLRRGVKEAGEGIMVAVLSFHRGSVDASGAAEAPRRSGAIRALLVLSAAAAAAAAAAEVHSYCSCLFSTCIPELCGLQDLKCLYPGVQIMQCRTRKVTASKAACTHRLSPWARGRRHPGACGGRRRHAQGDESPHRLQVAFQVPTFISPFISPDVCNSTANLEPFKSPSSTLHAALLNWGQVLLRPVSTAGQRATC